MKYDFLVAGFPKCGSTNMHNLLQQHPQIYLPKCKETFFCSKTDLYTKGDHYLKEHFYADAFPGQKIGSVEPSYSRYARRVEPYINADTKFIFLVRNPIDYLFSFYKMCMSFGYAGWYEAYKIYGDFSEIIKEYIKLENGKYKLCNRNTFVASSIANGRYFEYIRRYRKISDIRNIKIILFEEFIRNELETVREVFRFIGVNEQDVKTEVGKNKSESIMPNSDFGAFLLTKREYLHHTYVECRKDINGFGMKLCQAYYKFIPKIAAKSIHEQIDDTAYKLLCGYYNESVNELGNLMKLDLKNVWWGI